MYYDDNLFLFFKRRHKTKRFKLNLATFIDCKGWEKVCSFIFIYLASDKSYGKQRISLVIRAANFTSVIHLLNLSLNQQQLLKTLKPCMCFF